MTIKFSSKTIFRNALVSGGILALSAAALSGCSSKSDTASSPSATPSAMADVQTGSEVSAADLWAKAATTTDGMTSVFGTFTSNDAQLHLTEVKVDSSLATSAEMHQVVSGKMQKMSDGFIIPAKAKGNLKLAPGGYHIMLMGLQKSLVPGDTFKLTLTFEGGKTQTVEVTVRDYNGAQENYGDTSPSPSQSAGMSGMSGM